MELYLNKLAAALGTQLDVIVALGYPVQKVQWDRASMFFGLFLDFQFCFEELIYQGCWQSPFTYSLV